MTIKNPLDFDLISQTFILFQKQIKENHLVDKSNKRIPRLCLILAFKLSQKFLKESVESHFLSKSKNKVKAKIIKTLDRVAKDCFKVVNQQYLPNLVEEEKEDPAVQPKG